MTTPNNENQGPQDSGNGGAYSAPQYGGTPPEPPQNPGYQQDQLSQQPQQGAPQYQPQPHHPSQPEQSQPYSDQYQQQFGAPQYQPQQAAPQRQGHPGTVQNQYGSSGYPPQGDAKAIKGKPPLWLGITLAVAGPVIGVLILVVSLWSLAGASAEIMKATPGTTHTLQADQDYWIMTSGNSTSDGDCRVYGPDFSRIDVNNNPSSSASTDRNGQSMEMIATFTSEEAGDYSVSCPGVNASDTYVVEGNFVGLMGGLFGLVIGLLLGGFLFLVGIVLIIINRVTLSRRRREAGLA